MTTGELIGRGYLTISEIHDGAPSVIYRIVGSVNTVTRSMTGELSVTSVKCYVYKITGDTGRELTAEKTLRMRRVTASGAQAPVTVAHAQGVTADIALTADTERIEFSLYDSDTTFDDTTLLDCEEVTIVPDAQDLVDLNERVDTFDYIKAAMADGASQFNGGLMLSSLIRLGMWDKTNPDNPVMSAVYAGMNGIYNSGRTIASWWGGDMIDRFDAQDNYLNEAGKRYATALVRMDGSFYFANGNIGGRPDGSGWVAGDSITWNKDGVLTLGTGIKIDITGTPGLAETIQSILNFNTGITSLLVPCDAAGIELEGGWQEAFQHDGSSDPKAIKAKSLKALVDFWGVGGITALGRGSGSGSGSGGGAIDLYIGDWTDYAEATDGGKAVSGKSGKTLYDLATANRGNITALLARVSALEGMNFLTVEQALAQYVTSLGTSGNYLTWTKNGATSNITVPYAERAASLYENGEVTDFNGILGKNGIYEWRPGAVNRPAANYGVMLQWSSQNSPAAGTNDHWITQLASATEGYGLFYRTRANTSAWLAWEKILTSGNFRDFVNPDNFALSLPNLSSTTMNAVATRGNAIGMASLKGTSALIDPNGQTGWHHFVNISYLTQESNMWQTQIANKAGTTDLWVRSRAGGSVSDTAAWGAPWTRILTGTNYSAVLNGAYVTLATTQTISGAKTFAQRTRFNGVISAGESADDAYGIVNVCRPSTIENASYFSMVRAGNCARALGINLSNDLIMGQGNSDKTVTPWMKLSASRMEVPRLVSTVGTGTAPLQVSSTTLCTNLNADMLDGYHIGNYQTGGWIKLDAYNPSSATNYARYSHKLFVIDSPVDCILRFRVTTDINYPSYCEWVLRVNWSTNSAMAKCVSLMPAGVNRKSESLTVYIDGNYGVWVQSTAIWSNVFEYRVERGTAPTVLDTVTGTPPDVVQTIQNCGMSRNGASWGETVLQANAESATKLQTPRAINGTAFDGTGAITTALWGTAREMKITDATGANSGVAVSVNGSVAVALKLPATIAAALSGNASTATRLQGAFSLWGQSFYGNNVSGNMTGVGNITAAGEIRVTHTYPNIAVLRACNDNYGVMQRIDSTGYHFLLTDSGNPTGSFNDLRPLSIQLATGMVSLSGDVMTVGDTVTVKNKIILKHPNGKTAELSIDADGVLHVNGTLVAAGSLTALQPA